MKTCNVPTTVPSARETMVSQKRHRPLLPSAECVLLLQDEFWDMGLWLPSFTLWITEAGLHNQIMKMCTPAFVLF